MNDRKDAGENAGGDCAEVPSFEWERKGGCLVRWFECSHFPDAVNWVAALVDVSESLGHHPDVDIRYRRVGLSLTTHDRGGILTEKDFELAAQIDRLWKSRRGSVG